MRIILITSLFVLLNLNSCLQDTPKETKIVLDPVLTGYWTGEAQFINVDLNAELGKVPIKISISEENTIRGSFGEAKLSNGTMTLEDGRFDLVAHLDGMINSEFGLYKRFVVIFGTIPVGNDINAEFHLKSNLFFDFSMRQGGVDLVKND